MPVIGFRKLGRALRPDQTGNLDRLSGRMLRGSGVGITVRLTRPTRLRLQAMSNLAEGVARRRQAPAAAEAFSRRLKADTTWGGHDRRRCEEHVPARNVWRLYSCCWVLPPWGCQLHASPGADGQTASPPATGAAPKVEFEKYTLPNGLQVILHVDRKLPIVNVNQWFHVGSKNEKPGRTGFAHLFEHMMFQGSKHAEGEYLRVRGARGRQRVRGRRQRHDEPGPHELLRDGAVGQSRERALVRVGSAGDADRRDDQGEARQPARRREERAPAGAREPAVRPVVPAADRGGVPEGAPVFLARDRQPGRSHGGVARRREGVLQDGTTRRTTSRSSLRETSSPPRRRSSSRSTSAISRPARRSIGRPDGFRRWTARRSWR